MGALGDVKVWAGQGQYACTPKERSMHVPRGRGGAQRARPGAFPVGLRAEPPGPRSRAAPPVPTQTGPSRTAEQTAGSIPMARMAAVSNTDRLCHSVPWERQSPTREPATKQLRTAVGDVEEASRMLRWGTWPARQELPKKRGLEQTLARRWLFELGPEDRQRERVRQSLGGGGKEGLGERQKRVQGPRVGKELGTFDTVSGQGDGHPGRRQEAWRGFGDRAGLARLRPAGRDKVSLRSDCNSNPAKDSEQKFQTRSMTFFTY